MEEMEKREIADHFDEIPAGNFQKYLGEFKEAEYFALIKAGGECLDDYLVYSLRILHNYGLNPIVVHGGGMQIDMALNLKGIIPKKIHGKRITKDKETLETVIETLMSVNRKFVARVNCLGNYAKGFNKIFYLEGYDETYGFVGNCTGFDRNAIDACLERKKTPIISCLGLSKGILGKWYLNQNADSAHSFLVTELRPMKVLVLMPPGGIYKGDKLVSEMTIDELDEFLDSPYMKNINSGGIKIKLNELRKLLMLGFDVQITSTEYMLVELFSEKGHGTYLRGKK